VAEIPTRIEWIAWRGFQSGHIARYFNVVKSPSAVWTAQQLREAFAFTSPPKYLLRDRDGIDGLEFQNRARALGLEEVRVAPQSPWQSPYVERLIGSVRRGWLAVFS
jgi:hypothetical protein